VNNSLRRALQAGVVATCGLIAVSALVGSDIPTAARSQVIDYPPPRANSVRGVPGVSNRVQAVSVPGYDGPVLVCLRPGESCRELTGADLVPIGAYLDTSDGAAKLETRRADGRYTGTVVYAGLFQLRQARKANAVLVARLHGALPRGCRFRSRGATLRIGSSATKRKRAPRRRLWSDGTGRFRATGRYGSATVRGTKWLIEERCEGTLIRVRRGRVYVDDRVRDRTVVVRAPRSYLIRPRG
jgi:hypothetical protein